MTDKAFKIEGIDTEAGIKRFGGKAEIYKKSLMKFAAQYKDIPAPESDDLKSFAHQIKGVSANLGMNKLSETAADAEREPEKIAEMMKQLKATCMLILLEAENEGNGSVIQKTKTGGAAEYEALISELRGALKVCNPGRCEEIIARLEKTEWTAVNPVDAKTLKAHIENYDFDGALRLVL